MQDLNDMMVFLAVVETGSFTRAADRLLMPKANVSRKVSKLEADLGVTLLERTTRTQKLTEAGRRYLSHCKRIYEEAELAKVVVDDALHSISGKVKLGASVSIGQDVLKPAIGRFIAEHPKVELQINLTNQRVDLVEGGFDVLIRVGKLDDSSLIAKRLGSATRGLYASPDYLAKCDNKITINTLSEYKWLVMSCSIGKTGFALFKDSAIEDVRFTPQYIADDFSLIKQAAVEGLGITALPNYMCQQELKSGGLVRVLPEWQLEPSEMYALYPKNRLNLPKIKVLLDFLVETFQQRLNC